MPVIYDPEPLPVVVEDGDLKLEVDSERNRIGVTVKAWPADEPVTVYRLHADGTQVPVRAAEPFELSAGQAFVWDYEAPFRQAIGYRVAGASANLSIGSVQIEETRAWLRAPGLPALDQPLSLWGKPQEVARPRPASVRYPLGRATPIVRSGHRRAPAFSLIAKTYTDGEAAALLDLIDQASVGLLLIPNTRYPWQYVHVGDVTETAPVHFAGDSGIAPRAYWSLACTVVDRPVGGVFGDPTASWQAVVDAHPTWQDVLDTYPTWLDVLRGVPA